MSFLDLAWFGRVCEYAKLSMQLGKRRFRSAMIRQVAMQKPLLLHRYFEHFRYLLQSRTTVAPLSPKDIQRLLHSCCYHCYLTCPPPPEATDHRTSHQHGPGRKRQVLLDLRHPWTSPLPHQWKVAQVTRNAADLHGMGTGTLSVKFLGWFSSRASTYYPETSIQNCCQSFAPLIFDWGTES